MQQYITRLRTFSRECLRVLKVTRKPSRMEFSMIVKAAGLGMLVIGFLGFVILLSKQLIFG